MMYNKRCIINVATGAFYGAKQIRLFKSFKPYINGLRVFQIGQVIDNDLNEINSVDLTLWSDCLPQGSRQHNESPYGFKITAFNSARLLDYTSILWIDSPAYAVASPLQIFHKMEKEGYYIMSHKDPLCNSVSDEALEKFQVTRDQLNQEGLNLPSGSCYGFCLKHPKGKVLFENMLQHEKEGLFFSKDGRHRHDEAILALNMRRLGFPVFTFDPLFQSDSPECVIKSGDGQPE